MKSISYIFQFISILTLICFIGCTEKESEVPKITHYIKGNIGSQEIVAYQDKGDVQKIFGTNSFHVIAYTKYNEGFEFIIRGSQNPGVYVIDSLANSNDRVYIVISSNQFIYDNSPGLSFGELIIEKISQNPLTFKGSFYGKVIFRSSPQFPYSFDTLEVSSGVIDIAF